MLASFEIVHSEFTQRKKVLIDEDVYEPAIELWLNDLFLIASIESKHVECCSKHEHEYEKDEEEWHYINKRSYDQLDEKWSLVKHAKPVQHFHPHNASK